MGTSSSHISWGHGDKALISNSMLSHGMGHGAKSLTSISMLPPPLEKKCGVPGGPEPRTYAQSQQLLAEHATKRSMSLKRLTPRRRKEPETNLAQQTLPTVAPTPQEGRWYPQSRVERVKPNKAVSRQHGAYPKRRLGNCGKLRKAMV